MCDGKVPQNNQYDVEDAKEEEILLREFPVCEACGRTLQINGECSDSYCESRND